MTPRTALRALAGGVAAASAIGLPATALAHEPAGQADPSLRLHCPSAGRVLATFTGPYGRDGPVRDQVLRLLPYAQPYTQEHMRGRLDLRTSHDGGTSTAIVRGERREPIAVYRFAFDRGGWALRSSAECRSADPAEVHVSDGSELLTCPGPLSWSGIACGGGGAPGLEVDRAQIEERSPEELVRRQIAAEPGSYAARHQVGPLETTTRFENTWARVVARDAARNVIATWILRYEEYGWWSPLTSGCSDAGMQ
jgi:hypothetical protein